MKCIVRIAGAAQEEEEEDESEEVMVVCFSRVSLETRFTTYFHA